ncbi:N-acetyl-gamma-glutamyl-phosphate reductase [Arsukibacterium ikkense]|uniref:N-acetyl-gamma-glutamyl-phosphate reductase n=1 Tax=Arsukibacterium ikkense TaxID=336831 RepID=A0A0M2V6C0_9GAMM|nr:N-acetyl-gamma-glutamyl-phosphate reductase [Arsukibacterium ikkense]KKO46387.1 N-acetyl-gamma-glutamyl-phosphate reductase [Arsukibacterium ikkense]
MSLVSSSDVKIRSAVLGAAGYSGAELCALLVANPYFSLDHAFASSGRTAEPLSNLYPRFTNAIDIMVEPWYDERIASLQVDVAFLALPHEASEAVTPLLMAAGIVVVDLSGAFRLKQAQLYPQYYGYQHQHPELLNEAVYCLMEWLTEAPGNLISVPGCYPTACSLALLPLLKAGLVAEQCIPVINATSGVSGAGRKAALSTSFCEVGLNAYGFFGHRHRPEIEQNLGRKVVFTPHLGNFKRGILATSVLTLKPGVSADQVKQAFTEAYQNKPLVRLLKQSPNVANVAGTPYCDLYWQQDGEQLVVVSAIDNLLKGAAAQAMQAANVRFNKPETAGLFGGVAV